MTIIQILAAIKAVAINKNTIDMKTILSFILSIIFIASFSVVVNAHDEKHHSTKKDTIQKTELVETLSNVSSSAVQTTSPTEFSTLHPLVVHFPIVLLIIAALLQIVGVFYSKSNWDYITLFLLAGGVAGAYISSSYFHPHTEGLTSSASAILERHELFASLTLYSSLAALLLKIAGILIFKSRKRLFEVVTTLILLFSAVSVSIAGHWGAYLTHIEGVGPQGKFIEIE